MPCKCVTTNRAFVKGNSMCAFVGCFCCELIDDIEVVLFVAGSMFELRCGDFEIGHNAKLVRRSRRSWRSTENTEEVEYSHKVWIRCQSAMSSLFSHFRIFTLSLLRVPIKTYKLYKYSFFLLLKYLSRNIKANTIFSMTKI